MSGAHSFKQSEFRERITEAILEVLARLPETQRNVFIWNHYRGYPPKQIAEMLRRPFAEVEVTLDGINALLYQKIRALREAELPGKLEMQPASLTSPPDRPAPGSCLKSTAPATFYYQPA